jgi:trimeric autotransporter adhesin
MAQQSPLSTSLSVQNSAACPQTLASGFNPCSSTTLNTFAVDPNFRVGYAQSWQLAVQTDLPAALQMTATYLGIKGTRGVQEYLPNTYPAGAATPCTTCPVGFIFRTSNGNSTREAGSLQLRRRLRSGFTASLQYTYSKSIDDDSVLGGQGPVATVATTGATTVTPSQNPQTSVIAQNWLDLNAERGLSTFDQRNLLNAQIQYTSGVGLAGGSLLGGWRGKLLRRWTALGQITVGSGLPETPIYLAAVTGTGVTGSIRPKLTGASVYAAPSGFHLNAAAYTAPQAGEWGDAGRNSITGPGQFTFNASLARTFRLKDRYNLDARVDSTNLLNHVVFTGWNTTLNPGSNPALNSPLFGLPTTANAMRSLQTTMRLRF